MVVFERLLDLVAPDCCIACTTEGSVLCASCFDQLITRSLPNCYKCQKHAAGSIVCVGCRKKTPLTAVWVCCIYKGLAKDAVHTVKYSPSRSGARRLGTIMSLQVPYLDKTTTVITNAPTTSSRVRERGFDQSRVMAQSCAAVLGLNYNGLLVRESPYHQVGSSAADRQKHMKHGFSARPGLSLRGKDVLVVDDVMTTGATLESAARALKKAGAKRVFGIVFARGA